MAEEKIKIAIVGGGIHGLTAAIELKRDETEVIVFEKRPDLFQGTSGSTHNRGHMGYHYPQSIDTANECFIGLDNFKKEFPDALIFLEGYYVIAKDSRTSRQEYINFCKKQKLPYNEVWPSEDLLKRDYIATSFLVNEPIINVSLLKDIIVNIAKEKKIIIRTDTEVISSKKEGQKYSISTNKGQFSADIVVNATYAYTNNILRIFDLTKHIKKYKLQKTEVVVVESEDKIPPLTIMDGPYISIMPRAGFNNQYLIYDVENSNVEVEEGYYLDDSLPKRSNKDIIIKKCCKYFPVTKKAKYLFSQYGFRVIPTIARVQQRKTTLLKLNSKPDFYCIFEGKFISAPLIAKQLKSRIFND